MKTITQRNKNLLIILISVFVVSILFFLNWYFLHDLSVEKRGTMGDMFGVANALFSGLALAGIVITLWLQQQELKSQQLQIDEQKKEIILQRFETAFFNKLNAHREIVSGTYTDDGKGNKINGIRAFEHLYNSLLRYIDANGKDSIQMYVQENNLMHYFKYTYRIIKSVHQFDFKKGSDNENKLEKYHYVKTFRATISNYELLLIYFVGLIEEEKEFKELIETYSFLKNITKTFEHYQSKPSPETKLTEIHTNHDYHIQAFYTKAVLDKKFWKPEKNLTNFSYD